MHRVAMRSPSRAELDREGIYRQGTYYRALAMLDERLGKRRLRAIDIDAEHPLVRQFYELRSPPAKPERRPKK